jgi:hypothetical protein
VGDTSRILSKLAPYLRESLEALAQDQCISVDDLLVIAIAEKIARTEHSAWLAHQRAWTGTVLAPHRARVDMNLRGAELVSLSDETASLVDVFQGVPFFLAVLRGPDHIFDVVNQSYLELVGNRELIGNKIKDCLPELAGTVWIDRLNYVYRTGEPLVQRGERVALARSKGEPLADKYVDYAYKARRSVDGTISGLIVMGVDTSLVQPVQARTPVPSRR